MTNPIQPTKHNSQCMLMAFQTKQYVGPEHKPSVYCALFKFKKPLSSVHVIIGLPR